MDTERAMDEPAVPDDDPTADEVQQDEDETDDQDEAATAHPSKPTAGQMVTASGGVAHANGQTDAPAIITRVWGYDAAKDSWTVNLCVFPDAGAPVPATSVRLFADEAAAGAGRQYETECLAFWPTRV